MVALGSPRPKLIGQATTPGATKRARLSTWPSVWSFSKPSPSQMVVLTPRLSPSLASTSSVVVLGAAFQDQVVDQPAAARGGGQLLGDGVVVLQFVLAAPAVEAEGAGHG